MPVNTRNNTIDNTRDIRSHVTTLPYPFFDYDIANNITTTAILTVGNSITDYIETPGDVDWIKVELAENTRYNLPEQSNIFVEGIYDSTGESIEMANTPSYESSDNFGGFTTTDSGFYYIAVTSHRSTAYTLSIEVQNDATVLNEMHHSDVALDVAADITTTAYLGLGKSISGVINIDSEILNSNSIIMDITTPVSAEYNINTSDVDWIKVDLKAEYHYRIDFEGASTYQGTLTDPYLRGVHNSNGDLILGTTNDDGGVGYNSQIDFTATESGAYYISVSSFGFNLTTDGSNKGGTYTLSIDEGSKVIPDAVSDNIETTRVLNVNQISTSSIDTINDEDWFRIALEVGTKYQIDLEGSPTNLGTLNDPCIMGIYDSKGDLISGTFNDDGGVGYNSKIDFTATQTGVHYIAAGAFGDNIGSYALGVEAIILT